MSDETRRWLRRLGVALLAGLAAGLLVFIAARGVGGVALLAAQRDQLSGIAGGLGGLDGPPPIDLRAARLAIEALDQQYYRLSLLAGIIAGAAAALAVYLRAELRGGR